MRDARELERTLHRMDGAGYGAYKALKGEWTLDDFTLWFDYVQGDPFAAPSRVRLLLPADWVGLPKAVLTSRIRRVGAACALARTTSTSLDLRAEDRRRGSGGSGKIRIQHPGQVVGHQTALQIDPQGNIEARFDVGLPANGRRILGRVAATLLLEELTEIVRTQLTLNGFSASDLLRAAEVNEDQGALRDALYSHGLVAFVADGASLPRASGQDDRPLAEDAVAFVSPPELRVTLETPNSGSVTGMGVREGITLIVGGGFHGKSTLLRAIERGIRNHAPSDGRERVVTRADAVKIRAEDGRSVQGVDISSFISDLPGGKTTGAFSTPNASGSTSQASGIAEVIEVGARLLLIDEDTAATNFMIRDRRMQQLVPSDREPITPLIDRIRSLKDELGLSSILVLGGSGDYLDVADTIISMNAFHPEDVTERARGIAEDMPTGRTPSERPHCWDRAERIPDRGSVDARKGKRARRIRVHPGAILELGTQRIDLGNIEQIASESELRTLGHAVALIGERFIDGDRSIPEILEALDDVLSREGLDGLAAGHLGNLSEIRIFEVAALLNRLPSLRIR